MSLFEKRLTERGLSISRLNEAISYDENTGVFTWKIDRYRKARKNDVAGTVSNCGYLVICIDYKSYLAHRLAWAIKTGSFPINKIDHINRNRSDNRFKNLREATNKQNCENSSVRTDSKSGIRGVSWHKTLMKWQTKIIHNGKEISLGYHKDIFSAACARKSAELLIFTHSGGR